MQTIISLRKLGLCTFTNKAAWTNISFHKKKEKRKMDVLIIAKCLYALQNTSLLRVFYMTG